MSIDGEPVRRDHSTLSSVRNAARLLKEFSRGSREIGVTELSRRLGIGKSTAHRLLSTLADEKLLEQDPHTGAYRLGLAMYELGHVVSTHTDLHDACIPVLDQLRNATRETVQVAVLDGREVVYVERRESPQTLRLFGRVGHRNSAHVTSTGKLLLAFLPPAKLERTLDGWVLDRRTPHTIVDMRELREQLVVIRERGWADNINEVEMGVASVATPVRNGLGDVVAALSVAGPIQRINAENIRRYVKPCIDASLAISRRLGFNDATHGVGRNPGSYMH